MHKFLKPSKHSVVALLVLAFTSTLLHANTTQVSAPNNIDEEHTELNIHRLFPRSSFLSAPGLEFSLPSNFIALDFDGRQNYSGYVFWGPKEDIEQFFKNPSSCLTPMLAVLCCTTNDFIYNGTNEKEVIDYYKRTYPSLSITFGNWGKYYYSIASGVLEGRYGERLRVAIPEEGYLMNIELVFPGMGVPSENAMKFWNDFVSNTKALPLPKYLEAKGNDMYKGCTLRNIYGLEAKVVAERKRGDDTIRIVTLPMNSGLNLSYIDCQIETLQSIWNYGEQILHLGYEFKIIENHRVTEQTCSIAVLVVEVEEYTEIPEEIKEKVSIVTKKISIYDDEDQPSPINRT